MTVIDIHEAGDLKRLADVTELSGGVVCALGFFDGMHKAHRVLIQKAREHADAMKIPLAVLTFLADDGEIKASAMRIHTDDERLALFAEMHVDICVRCRFGAIKDLSAEDFVSSVLCGYMHTRVAVAGYNYRFGRGGAADVGRLGELLGENCATLTVIDGICDRESYVSSTLIRELIGKGELERATALMGAPYFITGEVSHGLGIGTGMGIPTLNTDLPRGKIPLPHGVYLTALKLGGAVLPALTNVGVCPTFGERTEHAETFILDYSGDLYGDTVRIYFLSFLREERTFGSKDDLLAQIKKDKELANKLLEEIKWQEIGLN